MAGFDLDEEKRKASDTKWAGKKMKTVGSLKELVEELEVPRRLLMMVPAGAPVDAVIADVRPLLEKGDVLIDGGNSFFQDTIRRGKELEATGISYVGMGVSGGEEGALKGPALMPGGPRTVTTGWKAFSPLLPPPPTALAALISAREEPATTSRWFTTASSTV